MEEHKKLTIALGVISLVLVALCIVSVFLKDRKGPDIIIPKADAQYVEGESKDALMKDVVARDNKDGDVTKSLVIESVTPIGNHQAVVEYSAVDSSNNLVTATRTVSYLTQAEAHPPAPAPAATKTTVWGY